MDHDESDRLTDPELFALLDAMFPNGVAGGDVLAELAPDGWEQSPLVACFHPPAERVFDESLQMHRRLHELRSLRGRSDEARPTETTIDPEPTLASTRAEYKSTPVNAQEELTELVGLCLWDVFSDNHDIVVADGRVADMGSFRGASAFLDEYLDRGSRGWREGDCLRFYMGTFIISGRADLTPVYRMIFRRLEAHGADWIYHFPELYLVELGSPDEEGDDAKQAREAERAKLHADVAEANARAREDALDGLPPPTVTAYRAVYGRDPRGWPPA